MFRYKCAEHVLRKDGTTSAAYLADWLGEMDEQGWEFVAYSLQHKFYIFRKEVARCIGTSFICHKRGGYGPNEFYCKECAEVVAREK